MSEPVLRARGLRRSYRQGPEELQVLQGIDLDLFPGERVAIIGSSGSGKTTLLHLLGGLDQADSGEVEIGGVGLAALNESDRCRMRNQDLGFVYQFHHLLPEFTALENVMMPKLIRGNADGEGRAAASAVLEAVGLGSRLDHKPAELSGGERQRVAIARALVCNPAVVLMDEPTGNLDIDTALEIRALMRSLSETRTTAFVVITHDVAFAGDMDRVFRLDHGVLHVVHGGADAAASAAQPSDATASER